ncbi:stalk domain-containing protein [Calderihabitans maritimus]|uniref:Mannosyl-glycoprotein endo-beta-N-acetylglucosamidase-like domain-containing protein n=1 Tax=Calderihabitans maritimus TaxID=1246530 RepID=A0A1Z5HPB9_9FIRM|nr:stalk domain-containing protein [Calderihabitans maritimus]GAW91288.1 hypothetical protein KKC1_04500 [Calderihabitans maritimus]
MHSRRLFYGWRVCVTLFLTLVMFIWADSPGLAADDVKLVIDGRVIDASPPPIIKNGRTLVPVRLVSETLGAYVGWHAESRTVTITKGNRSVQLRIDNRLVAYTEDRTTYGLSDVPPQIFGNRTFVPLRLVSNALGVSVSWNDSERTVYVDSSVPAAVTPFFDMALPSIEPGQTITGTTELQVTFNDTPPAGAAEVRFLLLDPETGRGPIVARGSDLKGIYQWLPDPFYNGIRVLAAAIYDQEGRFLAGCVIPVELAVAPQVALAGIAQEQVVEDSVSLRVDLNFVAEYVKYEITNIDTGNVMVTGEKDPQGTYTWTPQFADNGATSIRAIAYDRSGQAYYSPPVTVKVDVKRKLQLRGVSPGATVERPVTLWFSRNFLVSRAEYILKDIKTGKEEILLPADGQLSYKWFPGPEQAGTWELTAKVTDTKGNTYTTEPITIQVPAKPILLLESIGPNQVLTGTVKLRSSANVPLSSITYQLLNPETGEKRVIADGSASQAEYSWTPEEKDSGSWQIQAVATTISGEKIASEAIPVKVYLGPVYGPQPIIEKSKFLDFVSQLAKQSQERTGMSAALQVAQAILETGWGQYTPVDKYTGRLSYNLFGIKGQGPAGSVISNTWEEYNGNTFRVDATFRAYNNPAESWADHKKLLLTARRYEPFRAVMHNSTQGAWALRRAGYATDSKYPLKLISIIKRYDLHLLDEVSI